MVRLAAVLVAALAVLALHAPLRAAEDYPSKPVTIVVSLAAGTGMDALTRLYAEKLSQALGKPVIVENKPGAATTLAANQVANAPADGHTLVVLTSIALAINPTLYSSSGSRVRNRGPSPPARRRGFKAGAATRASERPAGRRAAGPGQRPAGPGGSRR